MKRLVKILIPVLLLALLLCGCSLDSVVDTLYAWYMQGTATSFADMQYTRPDIDAFNDQLDVCLDMAETADDVDSLMTEIYALYELYYDFYTNYNLANIHYCLDMSDTYWSDEYSICLENTSEIDAGLDNLLYALAECDLREELEDDSYFGADFFDAYDGESLWDDTFTALSAQENALLDRYYELSSLCADMDTYSEEFFSGYGAELEQVYVDLVAVRQEMAAYAGYDSYAAFSYEFYYYRDYTPEQITDYLADIRQELVPLYQTLSYDDLEGYYGSCDSDAMYDYVQECATAIGGTAQYAFELMTGSELYSITYSANKYSASFEVFLDSYYQPYVFVCPTGYSLDKLTFTHEFGHFCSDYAACGSYVSVDVAEIFSQSLEYLSLCYCQDTEALTLAKMADSLCIYAEQSAYADFEHRVYALSADELTVENVRALYEQVCTQYGQSSEGRDFRDYVLVPHFYIAPMYVISYVVSNDVALQIYAQELDQSGAGLSLWEDNLATTEMYFLAFLDEAGLESPFAQGRISEVREIFENALNRTA